MGIKILILKAKLENRITNIMTEKFVSIIEHFHESYRILDFVGDVKLEKDKDLRKYL